MKKNIYFILILAGVLFYNLYFRSFPVNFPQLKQVAANIIEQRVSSEAVQQVNKQFPTFSSFAKEELLRSWIREYKNRNKQLIKKQIQTEYQNLKKPYQGENSQTYLMELDCWHWARYVVNVCKFGHPGDEVKDDEQWDSLMLAPLGAKMAWNNFIFYFSASLYKLFSLIKVVPLFNFLFYLPLFFAAIFITAVFLFCYYYWGILAAAISSLFVGLAPIFLARSCAGWFDMDILNLFLPFMAVWTYLVADSASSEKKRLLWLFFSAFWVGLFCFTWVSWWFIFVIILLFEFFFIINLSFSSLTKEEHWALFKQHFFSGLAFIIFSFCWILLFSGPAPLWELYGQIKNALTLNEGLISNIWPNVYSTVGELAKPDVNRIAYSVGGLFLFISSLAGLNYLFLLQKTFSRFKYNSILIFTFWFLTMFFACSKGIRFAMFLIVPLGISLGGAVNQLLEQAIEKKKIRLVIAFSLLASAFLIQTIQNGYNTAKNLYPLINDNWFYTLVKIRNVTGEGAVINTWWDFGDWIKTIPERKVIFDGQSQNIPQGYWMARVLTSQSEEEAIAILRMLNNGGNGAFEILNQYTKNPFKSIFILKGLLSESQQAAREDLLQILPAYSADKIMKLLYDKPQEAYFMVDYTLEPKMPQISFLGNWDFMKLYLFRDKSGEEEKTAELKKLGVDSEQAKALQKEVSLVPLKNMAEWISGRLQFYSGLMQGSEKDGIVYFQKALIYNPGKKTVYLYSPDSGVYSTPRSLFTFENDKLEEKVFEGSDRVFSVLIIKKEQNYQAMVLDRDLAKSLFVRLYFLEGKGLKHFKPFLIGGSGSELIKFFKIQWE